MPVDGLTLLAALLTGLLGSTHCAVMCGGIATGFSTLAPGRGWGSALQVNLGRIGGYTLAGGLVGAFGNGLLRIAGSQYLVLVVVALRLLDKRGRMAFLARPGARLWHFLQPLHRRLLPANTVWRRLGMGMLWGWLPCGLSLTLLSAAWLQANARDGALTMAAFGLGTLPMMLPLTWSGARLGGWLQRPALRTTAAVFILLAGLATLAAPWLMRVPAIHGLLSALGCASLPG
jgi:sulfite exporter TauE/SafE